MTETRRLEPDQLDELRRWWSGAATGVPASGLLESELLESGLLESELLESGLLESELLESGLLESGLLEVVAWAASTPAWVEPYQQLVERMLAEHPTEPALVEAAERLAMAAAACPQIVGLDPTLLALRRAEWIDGNLWLELEPGPGATGEATSDGTPVPASPGKKRWAMFRIVGAEPRMWEVHGLPDLRIEQTMRALLVRTPIAPGEGQLIRSSY